MTTHIFHADVFTHGLYPDCPRCQEHAAQPEYLELELRTRILTAPLTSLDHEARERLLVRARELEGDP